MADYPTVPGPSTNLPDGHFTVKKTYRGEMHVGVSASASEVGNQPNGKQAISITGEDLMDEKPSV